MDAYGLIRDAILNRRQVHASYAGHFREMCPHALGRLGGRYRCLFYQFGGAGASPRGDDGSASNWRCMDLDALTGIRIVDGEWHTGLNHARPQTCVGEIDFEVVVGAVDEVVNARD